MKATASVQSTVYANNLRHHTSWRVNGDTANNVSAYRVTQKREPLPSYHKNVVKTSKRLGFSSNLSPKDAVEYISVGIKYTWYDLICDVVDYRE